MANKKIQIKNNAGDSLFPVTKRTCIDDFAHTHSFTGTAEEVSVSGTYSRATGVTINSITPAGSITLSRSANVALSTTSIGQITGVGTLPTRESKTVVTSAINGASATFTGTVSAGSNTTSTGGTKYIEDASISGGGSRTLSYLHYTAPSATKGSYTPAGSVTLSRSANVALSTSTISQITGVGSLPTMSTVNVATGVSTQPNFTATFSGTAVTPTGSITTSSTSLTLSGSYTPTGIVGDVQ